MSKIKKILATLIAVLLLGIVLGFVVFLVYQKDHQDATPAPLPSAEMTPAPTPESTPVPTPTPEPIPTPPPYDPPEELLHFQQQNEHVIALMDIPGTVIHYPVLMYPDPYDDPVEPYYLNRTIDLQVGYPGSIFVMYSEGKNFETFNTIIYGHNMSDGTMFGTLNQFENKDYLKAHPEIHIFTNQEEHVYKIAGIVIYDDRNINLTYDDYSEQDRAAYLQSLQGTDWVDGVELSTDSHIITLSTCIGGMPDNRRLLIAVEQDSPDSVVVLPAEGEQPVYPPDAA